MGVILNCIYIPTTPTSTATTTNTPLSQDRSTTPPPPTKILLPKKKPQKWSTGTAPGDYGGPPTTTKLRKYWGGEGEDPLTSDEYIWNKDFMGHMKRVIQDPSEVPSFPPVKVRSCWMLLDLVSVVFFDGWLVWKWNGFCLFSDQWLCLLLGWPIIFIEFYSSKLFLIIGSPALFSCTLTNWAPTNWAMELTRGKLAQHLECFAFMGFDLATIHDGGKPFLAIKNGQLYPLGIRNIPKSKRNSKDGCETIFFFKSYTPRFMKWVWEGWGRGCPIKGSKSNLIVSCLLLTDGSECRV